MKKAEGFRSQRIVVLPQKVVAQAMGHALLRGLLPTDAGFFPNARGHLRERGRGADQAIFIHCDKGAGWCEIGGARHVIHAGDLLVIPPGVPHVYGAAEQDAWTIHWFHAVGENLAVFLRELGVSAETPVLAVGGDARLAALFEEMLEVLERGYEPARLICAAQTLAHLLGMAVLFSRESQGDAPGARENVARSIEYMRQHLAGRLTVPTLAAMAHLSPPHFSALFRRQTGYSPMDYFIRLRMHRACQLLDQTEQGIQQIAGQLGYGDAFYFSRVFRSVNEVSPSEYRARRKG